MAFDANDRAQLLAQLEEFYTQAKGVIIREMPSELLQLQFHSVDTHMWQNLIRIIETDEPIDREEEGEKMKQLITEKARLLQEYTDTLPAEQARWVHDTATAILSYALQYLQSLSNQVHSERQSLTNQLPTTSFGDLTQPGLAATPVMATAPPQEPSSTPRIGVLSVNRETSKLPTRNNETAEGTEATVSNGSASRRGDRRPPRKRRRGDSYRV
ncbi:unnamed protein product [Clonostachys rosea]|uniref:Inhibitor of growth protein N-terminal histone-binding domain-containing protein n=1 Tax=Bionectria ochroleuca TaxID=29856 RepID=A0ABY6UKR4_BIOOC|nr:unnamed protein product [Clonostachys rosea]